MCGLLLGGPKEARGKNSAAEGNPERCRTPSETRVMALRPRTPPRSKRGRSASDDKMLIHVVNRSPRYDVGARTDAILETPFP